MQGSGKKEDEKGKKIKRAINISAEVAIREAVTGKDNAQGDSKGRREKRGKCPIALRREREREMNKRK